MRKTASILRQQVARCVACPGYEHLRALLIQAGQLEQGLEDQHAVPASQLHTARQITEQAAELFYQVWAQRAPTLVQLILGQLENLDLALQRLVVETDHDLLVKVPEGFEFYALYPEQYCLAAESWSEAHQHVRPRKVAVVGVRSIGTTLSALVAITLRAQGWEVRRETVRPTGPPFQRAVQADGVHLSHYRCGLVVDEGPGMSGSSIAAAAAWLREAGLSQISVLPGHTGEPGAAASEVVKALWKQTPRFVAPLSEITWGGQSLVKLLENRTRELLQCPGGTLTTKDLSNGKWRDHLQPETVTCSPTGFERMKLLVSTEAGGILWKFVGLGGSRSQGQPQLELEWDRTGKLSEAGWVPPLLGVCNGFVAAPWIEGRRLQQQDARDPTLLKRLADYLVASAMAPLEEAEVSASFERLVGMLSTNSRAALGEGAAGTIPALVAAARPAGPEAAYGDGRMAPHEWIRVKDGMTLKTDFTGHSSDHTLVGKQSFLWDVTGLCVEWDLGRVESEYVFCWLDKAGLPVRRAAIPFYTAAYAAFRMGMLWAQGKLNGQAPIDNTSDLYQRHLAQACSLSFREPRIGC